LYSQAYLPNPTSPGSAHTGVIKKKEMAANGNTNNFFIIHLPLFGGLLDCKINSYFT
jgi:hypothetical protein